MLNQTVKQSIPKYSENVNDSCKARKETWTDYIACLLFQVLLKGQ